MFLSSLRETLAVESWRHDFELATKGYTIYENSINLDVLLSIRNEICFFNEASILETSPNRLHDRILYKQGVCEKAFVERGGETVISVRNDPY